MPELSTSERLKQAQARVKALSASRDQIIGDIRVANQKLKQSYENLRELGVEAPEDLTLKQLSTLAEEFKTTLATKLESIEEVLGNGETLLQQYKELESE
jgi:hypothetical protein